MPVDTPHPAYSANIDVWTRCRDTYAGQDAVKAAGLTYLPRIDSMQNGKEYSSYKDRAYFHDGFARTIDGSTGSIARRDHVLDFPEPLQPLVEDVTGDGVSFAELVKLAAAECLITGRAGILIDFDDEKQRPTLCIYPAEAITNWTRDSVILRESAFVPDSSDPFKFAEIVQYRQLHLVEGVYTVTLWRRQDSAVFGSDWIVFDQIVPTKRGMTLDAVPFVWLSFLGRTPRIAKPPLLGLVNTAISYYRSSADLQHGRHWSGMPTLVVAGAEDDGPVQVGSTSALVFKSADAKVYYAEFMGTGLGSLERGLAELVDQLAVLGASVFGNGARAAETAEAARLRAGAETSILTGVVDAVQSALQAAMLCAADWMLCTQKPVVLLNRQFHDVAVNPQMLVALTASLQAGAITPETFAFTLDQARMLAPGEQALPTPGA